MVGHEENRLEEHVPFKVWKMLTPESRLAIKNGGEANIGIVKGGGAKENKRGGENLSSGHKRIQNKLLRLTATDGRHGNPTFMKEINELLQGGGAS